MGPKTSEVKRTTAEKSSQVDAGTLSRATAAVGGFFSYIFGYKEEEYDPYKHRKVPKPTNYVESLAHLIKGILGTGILAMPKGFGTAGLVPGLIISLAAALLMTHCMRVLIQQEYYQAKLARVPYLEYRDAAASALRRGPPKFRKFAKLFAVSVDFFLGLYHFGACTVYVLFLAENIKKIVDNFTIISRLVYIGIVLIPLILLNLIPNLKYLAPFSIFANAVTIISICIVIYYLISSPPKSKSPLDLWSTPKDYPLYFGTVLFALASVGVLVAIENNMKNPEKFGSGLGVLNVGMAFLSVVYIAVAVVGYNFCRDKCSDVVTLDLPQDSWVPKVVLSLFVIAIFISFPLNLYVPGQIITRYATKNIPPDAPKKKALIIDNIVRIVLPILCCVLAGAIPKLSLFISLFGSLCLSNMAIIFPMLMEALTSPKWPVLIKDIVIMLIGVMVLVLGTLSAVEAIVNEFVNEGQKKMDLDLLD